MSSGTSTSTIIMYIKKILFTKKKLKHFFNVLKNNLKNQTTCFVKYNYIYYKLFIVIEWM